MVHLFDLLSGFFFFILLNTGINNNLSSDPVLNSTHINLDIYLLSDSTGELALLKDILWERCLRLW